MTRADWQQIAIERQFAAQALLAAKLWASAYYIAGYAVESSLKSCILVRIAANPEVLFQEGGNKFSADCWTHDIEKLVKIAGLEVARDTDAATNIILAKNWETVQNWNEKSRYQMKSQSESEELYDAITDSGNGVMQWIRGRW